ncbi:hypothetical protein Y1Q_0016624 [Alligator mississippiensis]|uniref:MHC class I-like antigen recognition-like domain-containing protein n=1 Tax=Alligator mississippiensis TaxID=8496 RepID=A0A151P4Y2_ALLMI|nr:hypothetical protein Y1Q_0016624 [Alligator mississippiensis]
MGTGLRLLLLLMGAVSMVGPGRPHHLAVLVTGTEEEDGTHSYAMTVKLDEFVVAKYRSDTQEVRLTQQWVKRAVGDDDYMRELTRRFQQYKKGSKVHIRAG